MDPAFADFQRADAGNTSIDSVSSRNAPRGHRSRPSIGSSPLARTAHLPEESEEHDSPSQERAVPKVDDAAALPFDHRRPSFEPSALGNELGGLAAELEQHADVREMYESDMQTEDLPDLVTPALAK